MNDINQMITCCAGDFVRRENGLIYYNKKDDLITDERTALEFIDAIQQLDNSGSARVIVIQGQLASYTFEAQKLYFATAGVKKAALVCKNKTQEEVALLLKGMTKAFKSPTEVGVFRLVEDAEAWCSS